MTSNRPAENEYAIHLSPRAEEQLQLFPPLVASVVKARLNRLASRGPFSSRTEGAAVARSIQGHLIGRTFRALYEVDHEEGTVTVLDVAARNA